MGRLLCALAIFLAILCTAFAAWFVLSNLYEPEARAEDISTMTDVRTSCPPGCTLYGGTRLGCFRVIGSGTSSSLEECEAVDAGAPDSAMPVVAWHCPDGALGFDCENVQGEEMALHPYLYPYPALPSWLAILPPVRQDPYVVHFEHRDVVAEWGDGRKLSLNDLLRDIERLKREVRELRKERR